MFRVDWLDSFICLWSVMEETGEEAVVPRAEHCQRSMMSSERRVSLLKPPHGSLRDCQSIVDSLLIHEG